MLETQEIWQEPPPGGLVEAAWLTKPWRDVLRLTHDGHAPQPPIAHLCGRRLIDLNEGQAVLAMPASAWFCGPKGRLDAGIFAFLADMTHFYAVLSTLRAGAGCTTAELAMTFLGQPPCAGGEITTRSEVVYADERNALAVGMTYDDEGRPLAHSTSRYFLFPPERRRGSVPQPCRSPKGRHKRRIESRGRASPCPCTTNKRWNASVAWKPFRRSWPESAHVHRSIVSLASA